MRAHTAATPPQRKDRPINMCVRCLGRMFVEVAVEGPEYVCVQCGFRRTLRLALQEAEARAGRARG